MHILTEYKIRYNHILLLTITLSFSGMSANLAAKSQGNDQKDFSYAIGYQVGTGLKKDGLDIDTSAMEQGISDALKNNSSRLSPEETQKIIQAQQQKQLQKRLSASQKSKQAGEKFLAENSKKKGIVSLPSGLQYKVIKQGTGKKPSASNTVVAHYRGALINGKEFDSSYKRGKPASFPVNGVILGWQEILQIMPLGSKYQVFIPSSLGYGERGAGSNIGPNEALIFDIELLDIK